MIGLLQRQMTAGKTYFSLPNYDKVDHLLPTVQKVRYMIKPSSVTKRNIVDGMGKGLGMVYTPHRCWYSDRKSPYWEKSPKVS